jgi:geranylgeranyl reductase family protein
MEKYDVIIVGAGPIGCKVGELLGKDYKVLILEKKSEIGKPVQCTGFTSDRIFELSDVSKKVVLNKITKSSFFSPNCNNVTIKSKRPFYVLDRELFDKELAKKAEKNNAEIRLKTEFKNFKMEKDHLEIKTNKENFKTKLLIGADGPNSTVASVSGIVQPNNIVVGTQETIKNSFDSDITELWFGPSISSDFFAWVVPENEEWARVGLGSLKNSGYLLEKFIGKRFDNSIERKDKLSGVIRYGLIETSVADRVLLVGDAACQIKPLSGGGLVYGLIGAHKAVDACRRSFEEEKFDYEFLKENYDDKWKEKLRWPIIHLEFIRKTINIWPDFIFNLGTFFGKNMGFIIRQFPDEDFGFFAGTSYNK